MTMLSKLWKLSSEQEAAGYANLLQQLGIMRVACLYDGSAWALVDAAHLNHLQVSSFATAHMLCLAHQGQHRQHNEEGISGFVA